MAICTKQHDKTCKINCKEAKHQNIFNALQVINISQQIFICKTISLIFFKFYLCVSPFLHLFLNLSVAR